jgi:hypothetical protein
MVKKRVLTVFIFFLGVSGILYADTRKGNIELFVLLDKSLSMVEEIDSVKEYVADELVGRLLIPGDLFVLINFYGKTDRFFSGEVESRADIEALKDSLTSITADGRFTDIGSALDTLEKTVEAIPVRQGRKRYLLLLTDGKQEAPSDSPYYSPDGSFNHRLLEHTKEIAKKGWKIHILGIGTETAAEELAKELSAAFSSVREKPEEREIAQQLSGLMISISARLSSNKLTIEDRGIKIPLELEISDADEGENLILRFDSLIFTAADGAQTVLTPEDRQIGLTEKAGRTVKKDLAFRFSSQEAVPGKTAKGEIRFVFNGDTVFQPAVFDVVLTHGDAASADKNETEQGGGWQARWPFVVAGLIALIVIVRFASIALGKKRDDDDKRRKNPVE